MPCGHGGLCYRCGLVLSRQERKQQCPICRGQIEHVLKISKCELRNDDDQHTNTQRVFVAEEGIQLKKVEPKGGTNSNASAIGGSGGSAGSAGSGRSNSSLIASDSIVPTSSVHSPRNAGATVTPIDEAQQRELEMTIVALVRESQEMIDLLDATGTLPGDGPMSSSSLESPHNRRAPSTTEGESKSRYAEITIA